MPNMLGPAARRIYDQLRERIEDGTYTAGERLPSNPGLAREFDAAVMTVRHALQALERQGYVSCRHGRGTFVFERAGKSVKSFSRDEQYRSLVDASPDGILMVDLEGNIVMVNQRAAEMHGFADPRELMRANPRDLVAAEYLPHSAQNLAAVAGGATLRHVEYPLRRVDGQLVDAELSAAPVRDETGRPVAITVVVRDISDRKQVEVDLQASEARYRTLLEASPEGIIVSDSTGRIVLANWRAATIFGYQQPSEMVGLEAGNYIARGMREEGRSLVLEALRRNAARDLEIWLERADGTSFLAEVTGSILTVPNGRDTCFMSIVRDVTEQRRVEEQANSSREQYRVLLDSAPAPIAVQCDGRVVYVNPAAMELLGGTCAEDFLGLSAFSLIHRGDRARVARRMQEAITVWQPSALGQQRFVRLDGRQIDVEITVMPVLFEGRPAVQVIGRDVTERMRYEGELRRQALHDHLTGLPNRTLLIERLNSALCDARGKNDSFALLVLDLDRFKEVNDAFGHDVGDCLLHQVAERASEVFRDCDTIARMGGDEFAVLLSGVDEEGAAAVAQRLVTALSQPVYVQEQPLYLGASVGIVIHPDHGNDAKTLLRRAEVAMYEAKRKALGYSVYRQSSDPHSADRLRVAAELRHAIEHDELVLHFQPLIELPRSRVNRAEALVRWNHPSRGLVSPGEFIPVAEQMGLMRSLTMWALDDAVRHVHKWSNAGMDIAVAVNLSAWNLHDSDLVDTVARALARWHVAPSRLRLEITESALMQEPVKARATLTFLRELGVTVAIDDFGTGYSSLAYLKNLPVDEIKIDRSFVQDMGSGGDGSFEIVRSIVGLGHNLGLEIVAEGVETQHHLDALTLLGCDSAQGFLISKPLAGDAFLDWLICRESRTQFGVA